MKKILFAIVFLMTIGASAQGGSVLNQFQLAIVPKQFSFLKKPDQYMLNTYTKLYLNKYGFKAFMEGEDIPMDAMSTNSECGRVYANLLSDGNMFVTRIQVQFKDCNGNILYTSEEGTSRQKDFQKAYREALANAFASFETLGYKYEPGSNIPASVAAKSNNQAAKTETPAKPAEPVVVDANTLFAQPVENGYQLINTVPAVVFKLQKTSSPDVFIAQKGNVSGTLINKNGTWTFESYQNGKLETETVKIKF